MYREDPQHRIVGRMSLKWDSLCLPFGKMIMFLIKIGIYNQPKQVPLNPRKYTSKTYTFNEVLFFFCFLYLILLCYKQSAPQNMYYFIITGTVLCCWFNSMFLKEHCQLFKISYFTSVRALSLFLIRAQLNHDEHWGRWKAVPLRFVSL